MSAIDIAAVFLGASSLAGNLALPVLIATGKVHTGRSCDREEQHAPEPATVPLALPAVNGQAGEVPRVVDPSAKPQARNQFGHFVPRARES